MGVRRKGGGFAFEGSVCPRACDPHLDSLMGFLPWLCTKHKESWSPPPVMMAPGCHCRDPDVDVGCAEHLHICSPLAAGPDPLNTVNVGSSFPTSLPSTQSVLYGFSLLIAETFGSSCSPLQRHETTWKTGNP